MHAWIRFDNSHGKFSVLNAFDGLRAFTVVPVAGGFALFRGYASEKRRINGSYVYRSLALAMADAEYHYLGIPD